MVVIYLSLQYKFRIVLTLIEPLSNNPNESYTRNPDLTEFEQHSGIQGSGGRLFSPGTK